MAEINVQRKSSNAVWWIIGLIILALVIWALFAWGTTDQAVVEIPAAQVQHAMSALMPAPTA